MIKSSIYMPNLYAKYSIKEKDSYVVITGGSDGIGEEYAMQLANQGFNIILIARTLSKLERVKARIQKHNPKSKVVVIQADFENNSNVVYYEKLMKQLEGYDIAIAIVNAGVFPLGLYEQLTNREVQQQIDVNVYQYGMLGKMLMDKLLKRDHATLLAFVGSFAGFGPLPGLNMYAATKGFVAYFTESMAYEIYGQNLDISTYTPLGVQSAMTNDFSKNGDDSIFNEDFWNIGVTTSVRSHLQELSSPFSKYMGISCMGYYVHSARVYYLGTLTRLLPDVYNATVMKLYLGYRDNQIENWKNTKQ